VANGAKPVEGSHLHFAVEIADRVIGQKKKETSPRARQHERKNILRDAALLFAARVSFV
jgi:hypothetical protein